MPRNVEVRLLDSVTWCWLYLTFNRSCLFFHHVISVRHCQASLRCVLCTP